MLRALRQFAARPEVNGFVLDLAGNAGLAADYAQWDAAPQCAPAANIDAKRMFRSFMVPPCVNVSPQSASSRAVEAWRL